MIVIHHSLRDVRACKQHPKNMSFIERSSRRRKHTATKLITLNVEKTYVVYISSLSSAGARIWPRDIKLLLKNERVKRNFCVQLEIRYQKNMKRRWSRRRDWSECVCFSNFKSMSCSVYFKPEQKPRSRLSHEMCGAHQEARDICVNIFTFTVNALLLSRLISVSFTIRFLNPFSMPCKCKVLTHFTSVWLHVISSSFSSSRGDGATRKSLETTWHNTHSRQHDARENFHFKLALDRLRLFVVFHLTRYMTLTLLRDWVVSPRIDQVDLSAR